MSTYANVLIAGREFNVRSDGWHKNTIRDCVREYVAEIKSKVKPDYLNTAVVDAIASGVDIKQDLLDGHSKIVIQASIDIARQLGITEKQIQEWELAREIQYFRRVSAIRLSMNKLEQSPITQAILGRTKSYVYTLDIAEHRD